VPGGHPRNRFSCMAVKRGGGSKREGRFRVGDTEGQAWLAGVNPPGNRKTLEAGGVGDNGGSKNTGGAQKNALPRQKNFKGHSTIRELVPARRVQKGLFRRKKRCDLGVKEAYGPRGRVSQ